MNPLIVAALAFQTLAASCAVIFNLFLLYIIRRFTTKSFGFYKYILMSFAVFEIIYAIVVLLSCPIFFISQRTLIAFTYYGLIAQTPIAILGPTTYCFFYELWLGHIVCQFLYRLITVSHRELRDAISQSKKIQAFLWLLIATYVFYTFFCAYYACTRNSPHQGLLIKLYEHFGIDVNKSVPANYVMRFTDPEGHFSPGSTVAVLTHYFIITVSILTVMYCSWRLWSEIQGVKKNGINICLERQLFKSLILQTTVPVLFSHFPSLVAMSFPLIEFDVDVFSFFSVFTTVPKALDPIILILVIKCYRRGVRKLLSDGAKVFIVTNSTTSPEIKQ